MEKNPQVSSTRLKLLLLVLLVLVFHGYGSHHDQAGRLRAMWRAKRRNQQSLSYNYEWQLRETGLDDDGVLFDVGKMEDDLTKGGLPGQPPGVTFKQYAGYVNVDAKNGRNLFYYFAEAVENSSSKPLVLWLNRGPGCSSSGMGALVEVGPFGVRPDGETLYSRRHAWNRAVNMLFLESPAGVGFSYSNTTTDYNLSGDKRTAQDMYTFLVNWFKRYPHYRTSDFYIAGESYAGFYIPELASTVNERNRIADYASTSIIQLKGIMVGNGIMDDMTDQKGSYDYVWTHALVSDETYHGLVDNCLRTNSSKICDEYEDRIGTDAGNIDFYNIYRPVCLDSSNSSKKVRSPGEYDPCEGDYVYKYLNLGHVQRAFHANVTRLPHNWELCSDLIDAEKWKDSPSSMFPMYRRLIASGLRILLYSGDTDAVVPVSGTRYAIDARKLKVIKPWHPWSDDTFQFSGYTVVYDGLIFTTVRDAGHQVPQCQPRRALALFKSFLEGT